MYNKSLQEIINGKCVYVCIFPGWRGFFLNWKDTKNYIKKLLQDAAGSFYAYFYFISLLSVYLFFC